VIRVGEIFIHEAGHVVAALATGGTVGRVWASATEGTTMAGAPPTPFAELLLLAAGEASKRVKTPYAVAGDPPFTPRVPVAGDESRSAIAALYAGIETIDQTPQLSDRDRVAAKLEELIAAGRIKRREDLAFRWWMRARYAAQRLLTKHHRTLATIATNLARTGALTGEQVAALWLTRWERHSFTGGDRART
jgi:hypothetical protein